MATDGDTVQGFNVSIQLMSPASGDSIVFLLPAKGSKVSIQLMSPASGDQRNLTQLILTKELMKFPFN